MLPNELLDKIRYSIFDIRYYTIFECNVAYNKIALSRRTCCSLSLQWHYHQRDGFNDTALSPREIPRVVLREVADIATRLAPHLGMRKTTLAQRQSATPGERFIYPRVCLYDTINRPGVLSRDRVFFYDDCYATYLSAMRFGWRRLANFRREFTRDARL